MQEPRPEISQLRKLKMLTKIKLTPHEELNGTIRGITFLQSNLSHYLMMKMYGTEYYIYDII